MKYYYIDSYFGGKLKNIIKHGFEEYSFVLGLRQQPCDLYNLYNDFYEIYDLDIRKTE